jgi:hypothetical protein
LDAGEAEIVQDGGPLQNPLKSEYDTNAIGFFAVNLIWKSGKKESGVIFLIFQLDMVVKGLKY